MPEVGSASFLKRFHSGISKERNRYDVRCDCHCCEAAIGFCSAGSCQGLFWMELPDKKGSPEPLRWRRGAGGKRPGEGTPQLASLRACDLNDAHSRNFYRLHWESVPQEHHRIAQKEFALAPRMTLMNLAFSLPTFAPPLSLVLLSSRAGCE